MSTVRLFSVTQEMKWPMYVGIFFVLLLLLCFARRFCRLESSSSVPSREPPSTQLQPPSSSPHYMYVPSGNQVMGPGGAIWVPEPNSSWQPAGNHQMTWSGQNQSNQGLVQQGFPTALFTSQQLGDLPPTYDEAVLAKP